MTTKTETDTISEWWIDGDELFIDTPYCQDVINTCRKWGGSYNDYDMGCWVVPASRKEEVIERLGDPSTGLVEVEVGLNDLEDRFGQQIRVGWHVLAGRRSRDYRANIYATLVAGEVPERGGSRKNPEVAPKKGARFRLKVPRDFAKNRGLQIINKKDELRKALKTELKELKSRIKEVEAELQELEDQG